MATAPGQVNEAQIWPDLSTRRRRKAAAVVAVAWTNLVLLYFLWETLAYRGLYAKISEWQFDQFGHYLPILTITALVLLFSAPAAWLTRAILRSVETTSLRRKVLVTSNRFRNLLLAMTAAMLVSSLGSFLWAFTLPSIKPPYQHVYASNDTRSVKPGAATLSGYIVYSRTAAYTQRFLLKRRGVRFAPVISPGQQAPEIRYFIELAPSDVFIKETGQPISTREGALMKNALPGSIETLYQYAGYKVAKPYFILYTSEKTMRWPYYISAIQLLFISGLLAIAAAFQHRRTQWVSSNISQLKRRKTRPTS